MIGFENTERAIHSVAFAVSITGPFATIFITLRGESSTLASSGFA
jgi:hypothetical protein